MHIKAVVSLIYGLIIIAGGIMGYVMAQSTMSLVSGGVLGLLVVIGAALLFSGQQSGQVLALVGTLAVAAFFGFQLYKALSTGEGSVGRAAGIVVLSLIELAVLLFVRAKG